MENLEACRTAMDQWLRTMTSNPLVLCTQSMYQFLCFDANMPPPYLEIHWRNSANGSFDEMDMDDMFERHAGDQDALDGNHDFDDDEEDDACWDGHDSMGSAGGGSGRGSGSGTQTVWQMQNQQQHQQHGGGGGRGGVINNAGSKQSGHNNRGDAGGQGRRPSRTQHANNKRPATDDDDAKDGLDIQSLSVVEGEVWYERESKSTQNVKRAINLDSFHIIRVIGKGSFGKVFLVREKATSTLYALKVLKKDYIIRKNQVEHTKTERSVLGYVHHPFIVGLSMAFQTTDKLFFVLDYCAGGELFFHLGKVGRFPEDRAKFYAAQIVLALEYVHSLDIIYRDLKPENVLLDQAGNVRLTDFGLSKEGVSDHSTGANSFCGTPEYIAPEVLLRQGHGRAVDWWSLGALLYEMISGLPPFYSRNRETMFEKIMNAELTFPAFMSEPAKEILSKLLVRDPTLRLGSGERDAAEIKEMSFFADVDWAGLAAGRITPAWTPSMVGSLDTSQFDQEFTSMLPIVSPDVRDAYFGSMDKAFEGFSFVHDNVASMMISGSVKAGPGATLMSTSMRR